MGCGPEADLGGPPRPRVRTEMDRFGLVTCSPATATRTCFTHRAILGVSMGAHGAGTLGLGRPELFDTVGLLGVPMVDWVFMLRQLKRSLLGGFCDRETLLAVLAEDPDALDDPDRAPRCDPAPSELGLTPDGAIREPEQSFNHWHRWIDAGRGGGFGRSTIVHALQDIARAFGNPTVYNPDSPYLPPGVPPGFLDWSVDRQCDGRVSVEGLHDRAFDPTGAYPWLVPCDHGGRTGTFDPARPPELSLEMVLAVDYNRNGRRDLAEPLVVQMSEPFEDVGCAPDDRYDWRTNPEGTGQNWLWERCEPFEDVGLDGVSGTGDYGEGNQTFDLNPNVARYLRENPRGYVERMPAGQLDRLNIYADAGIRDFLVSAGGTNWFWGALRARTGVDLARDYDTFDALDAEPGYEFLRVGFDDPAEVGRHVYVRYGDAEASPAQIARGDGHHVGPPSQIVDRFLTAVAFADSRWRAPDRRRVDDPGDLLGLVQTQSYFSTALGRDRGFGVVLPPGYDDPAEAEARYPVLYFLHGQGQESEDLLATSLLFFAYMADSNDRVRERLGQSDWGKFIIVFPDSTCDPGACRSGNFNGNHSGIDGAGPAYADAFFELMAHVERTYRVRLPVEVPRP